MAKPRITRSAKSRRTPRRLVEVLHDERSVLIDSVIAGGLCDARQRSSPPRIVLEAGRFLDLLVTATDAKKKREVREHVMREVREGAFASASPGDVDAIFDAWRRTFAAFCASMSGVAREVRLNRVVERLYKLVAIEAKRWAQERIDVIVIGASAGGIHALQEILGLLSDDLPATVLIVQHVSAKAPSLMPVVLGRSCEISVLHAVDGARLLLGNVYVAPPAHHLSVEEGRLRLIDGPLVRHSRPAADVLFAAAAAAYGRHVASVVLSGSDGDGANGSRAVRNAGGVVIAQHPGSAQFPSMPEAAIATGAVELVVALPLIAKVLERLVRQGRSAIRESKQ